LTSWPERRGDHALPGAKPKLLTSLRDHGHDLGENDHQCLKTADVARKS
jgi:hypothetical protein